MVTLERAWPGVTGRVRLWILDRTGRVLCECVHPNLVVDAAKLLVADLLRGAPGSTPWAAMAVGEDGVDPIISQVGLGQELARLGIPTAGTDTDDEKNLRVGSLVTIRQTFTGLTGTIREYGLVGNISSPPGAPGSGTLFNRGLIGPGPVTSGDLARVEATFDFS